MYGIHIHNCYPTDGAYRLGNGDTQSDTMQRRHDEYLRNGFGRYGAL